MFIHRIPKKTKKKTYVSVLLRESYRVGKKVRHRTIANLSTWPDKLVRDLELLLKGGFVVDLNSMKEIKRKQGKSYGAFKVIYEIAKRIGITKALGKSREQILALIMIAGIIIVHKSKRYIAKFWSKDQAIEEILGFNKYYDEDDLYETLKWLSENQLKIEKKLWREQIKKRIPKEKALFLYDVTSSYVEGKKIALTSFGYNRDGKKGKKQIVIGLMTDKEGIPVCVEVFEGNTKDNATVANQLKKISEEFGVKKVIFVGDRGMLKSEQINNITGKKWEYINAITKPQIIKLINEKVFEYTLFDEKLCEIEHKKIRYILKKNPLRAEELKLNLESKINWFIEKITKKNKYLKEHARACAEVALRELKKNRESRKLEKIIEIKIKNREIIYKKIVEKIDEYLKLAGCYVIKSNVPINEFDKETIHQRYKDLSKVEQAFETLKTGLLEIRPIFVRKEEQVRGHVFCCMLALKITNYIAHKTKSLNLPLEYIIETLDKIQTRENIFKGQTFKCLPNILTDKQEKILNLLRIKFPTTL